MFSPIQAMNAAGLRHPGQTVMSRATMIMPAGP
jgi:hypothetical protein